MSWLLSGLLFFACLLASRHSLHAASPGNASDPGEHMCFLCSLAKGLVDAPDSEVRSGTPVAFFPAQVSQPCPGAPGVIDRRLDLSRAPPAVHCDPARASG
jgi:hypothetical protein